MKNQTDNSLFTDIKLDEAANVNGGSYSYSYFVDYASSAAFAPISNSFYSDWSNASSGGDYIAAVDRSVYNTLNTLSLLW